MAGSGDFPAIEGSGMGMKLPIGMTRRALSYDDNLEAPMSTPPHDISINNLWRRPVIPERKFSQLAEEDESHAAVRSAMDSARSRPPAVVKTKASSLIVNSIITKHTHDSMSKFEQRAGLSDTGYTPHKGLMAEETRHHHRMPEALQKLQIQSLEHRDDKQSSSAQSTPSTTPHSSPRHQRRGWFGTAGSEASVTSNSSVDLGGGDTAGGAVERWGVFGPRPVVHKSTSDVGSESTSAGINQTSKAKTTGLEDCALGENPYQCSRCHWSGSCSHLSFVSIHILYVLYPSIICYQLPVSVC